MVMNENAERAMKKCVEIKCGRFVLFWVLLLFIKVKSLKSSIAKDKYAEKENILAYDPNTIYYVLQKIVPSGINDDYIIVRSFNVHKMRGINHRDDIRKRFFLKEKLAHKLCIELKTKIVYDREQINGTQNKPTFSDERTTATKYKNPILFDYFLVIFRFICSAVKAFTRASIHNDDSITNHNKERTKKQKIKISMSLVSFSFKSVRYTLRSGTFLLCECESSYW